MHSITVLERVLQIHLRRRNGPSGHVARVMALRTIWQLRALKAAQ